MIAELSGPEVAAVLAASAFGGLVQGSAGIGMGLVAGPVLLSIDTDFAPGPMLVAGVVIAGRHLTMEWGDLDRSAFRRSMFGAPVGAVAALLVLSVMSTEALALTIGVLICVMCAALLAGVSLRRTDRTDVITGAGAAFTSLAAALPGPPLVIGFHDLDPKAMRCTVSLFITAMSAFALVSLAAIGRFGGREATLLALMVPGVAAGVVLSRWTRPWLDRAWFRPAVLVLAFLGGAALVVSQM